MLKKREIWNVEREEPLEFWLIYNSSQGIRKIRIRYIGCTI